MTDIKWNHIWRCQRPENGLLFSTSTFFHLNQSPIEYSWTTNVYHMCGSFSYDFQWTLGRSYDIIASNQLLIFQLFTTILQLHTSCFSSAYLQWTFQMYLRRRRLHTNILFQSICQRVQINKKHLNNSDKEKAHFVEWPVIYWIVTMKPLCALNLNTNETGTKFEFKIKNESLFSINRFKASFFSFCWAMCFEMEMVLMWVYLAKCQNPNSWNAIIQTLIYWSSVEYFIFLDSIFDPNGTFQQIFSELTLDIRRPTHERSLA